MFNNQMKKMNCIEVSRKLSPYQDNELDPDVRSWIEDHLSGCKNCRIEFEALEGITADILSIGDLEPLENFNAGVMSLVNGYRDKKYSGKFALAYSFVFALFFGFGVFFNTFSPVSLPQPEIAPELSSVLLEGQKFNSADNSNSVIIQLAGGINEKRTD